MPLQLIDKQDNFELIRNEIAAILAAETLNQQALATAAGKDPNLWKFHVYIERSRPWEALKVDETPMTPIVNVWYESSNYDGDSSFIALEQTADPSIFNIDIYGAALSEKNVGDGYKSGDKTSALESQRIIRLVRNILRGVPPDSSKPGEDYTFLNLRGIVGHRKIQSINRFFTDYDKQAIPADAARITLAVRHLETSGEGPYEDLNLIQMSTEVDAGGLVRVVDYEFDTTTI